MKIVSDPRRRTAEELEQLGRELTEMVATLIYRAKVRERADIERLIADFEDMEQGRLEFMYGEDF